MVILTAVKSGEWSMNVSFTTASVLVSNICSVI